jgi:hypothetical protein
MLARLGLGARCPGQNPHQNLTIPTQNPHRHVLQLRNRVSRSSHRCAANAQGRPSQSSQRCATIAQGWPPQSSLSVAVELHGCDRVSCWAVPLDSGCHKQAMKSAIWIVAVLLELDGACCLEAERVLRQLDTTDATTSASLREVAGNYRGQQQRHARSRNCFEGRRCELARHGHNPRADSPAWILGGGKA